MPPPEKPKLSTEERRTWQADRLKCIRLPLCLAMPAQDGDEQRVKDNAGWYNINHLRCGPMKAGHRHGRGSMGQVSGPNPVHDIITLRDDHPRHLPSGWPARFAI
jgi:hypothetical protein